MRPTLADHARGPFVLATASYQPSPELLSIRCLTSAQILVITNGSDPDESGGVFDWLKFAFKRENPSKMLCADSSARCSRKTLSRRSNDTPFI